VFHVTRKFLRAGDVIEPGNWGSVIRSIGISHPSWDREANLERIRASEFSHKPDRFNCTYAFVTIQGALWWRAHERHGASIYAVEGVDPSAPSHVGDLLGVNRIATVDATEEAAARRYWSGSPPLMVTPDQVAILEFLTSGGLCITGVLA